MSIRNRDIVNCFPLLASVLGDRYGVSIQIGGNQAKTDGRVIYLPAMPPELDSEALEAARGYVDHESAHIRYTDFELLKNAQLDRLENWLTNALEDWRVEKKLTEIFPGCGNNFRMLVTRLFGQTTGAGHKNPASVILNYVLLTVRSWSVPEIDERKTATGRLLSASLPDLKSCLDRALAEVSCKCSSTGDAIAYAQKLAAAIREHCAVSHKQGGKAGENKNQAGNGDANADNHNAGNRHVEAAKFVASKDDAQTAESRKTISAPDSVCGTGEPSNENPHGITHASESSDCGTLAEEPVEMELPQNLSEILSEHLEIQACDKNDDGVCVAAIGKKSVHPFSREERIKALKNSVAMRQRLSGLLLAKTSAPGGRSRKGRLETGVLHRICVGDARVFRQDVEKQGLDTAIHILLDCSSSMSGKSIIMAREACYAIISALSGINGVNLALTVFPADEGGDTVFPVIRHGQRRIEMPSFGASGSTPLGPALWWVLTNMLALKENRKIVLIISDGMPTSLKAAARAISHCEKQGLELMGIGIQSRAIANLLPRGGRTIWKLEELGSAIFELMHMALINGGSHEAR